MKLAHPAGDTRSGKVTLDGREELAIPPEVVSAIPPKYEKAEPEEVSTDYADLQIVVRAADLDKTDSGWAAIAAEITDRRIPLEIAPSVDVRKIPVGKYVRADVTLISKQDLRGHRKPLRLILKRLGEPVSQKKSAQTSDPTPDLPFER